MQHWFRDIYYYQFVAKSFCIINAVKL